MTSGEERTGFGLPSPSWSGDIFKIIAEKVPSSFAGEGPLMTFVLPCINEDASKSWTKTPVPHPNR